MSNAKLTIFFAVADVDKFEEKLRQVLAHLGIKDGVSVQVKRSGDISGKILFTLVATGVMSWIEGYHHQADEASQAYAVDPVNGSQGVFFKNVAGLQEAKQDMM